MAASGKSPWQVALVALCMCRSISLTSISVNPFTFRKAEAATNDRKPKRAGRTSALEENRNNVETVGQWVFAQMRNAAPDWTKFAPL